MLFDGVYGKLSIKVSPVFLVVHLLLLFGLLPGLPSLAYTQEDLMFHIFHTIDENKLQDIERECVDNKNTCNEC